MFYLSSVFFFIEVKPRVLSLAIYSVKPHNGWLEGVGPRQKFKELRTEQSPIFTSARAARIKQGFQTPV